MRRILGALAALMLVGTASAAAQDTAAVKAYLVRDSIDIVDSLGRDKSAPQYSKRAAARILARRDSILASLRLVVTPAPVPPDTTTQPDTTTPGDTTTKPPTPAPDTTGVVTLAQLPLATPSADYPASLTPVTVAAGASLQAAIDAAPCNAELLLAPGATYGITTWRARPCNGVPLAIRTAGPIPARGTRVTPALSATWQQAKIVTSSTTAAITAMPGASGYYLENVEVSCPVNGTNACVWLGMTDASQNTVALAPNNITLSHVYVHGAPTAYLRRCVYLNTGSAAIVDSWLSECHENNTDSQAILGGNGPGPYLIENNYLEAGHEVIMFGGFDPAIKGLTPADITIRRNHITRPVAWKGVWKVKNLIETKNAKRVLIEANVIENTWADGQTGHSLLFKSVNQGGGCPTCVSRDITVRRNLIRNAGAGTNIAAAPQGTVEHASHITIYDNLWLNINAAPFTGEAREVQLLSDLTDIAITHNTFMASGVATAISFDGQPPKMARVMFASNIYENGAYGIHGTGTVGKNAILAAIDTAQMVWTYNVATGASCSTAGMPTLNRCAASATAAGLDATGALSPSSAYALPSHDGQPVGANAAAVYAAVVGVVTPDPSRAVARRPRAVATPSQSGWHATSRADARRDTNGAGSAIH